MEERKNGLPIVSLILGIAGCFFTGGASINDSSMIGFGMTVTLVAIVCAIISIFNARYKKTCAFIALVLCIISFMFFNNWSNDKAESEAYWNEYNSRTYTITFDTNGGEAIAPMQVHPNTYLSPITPYKSGYEFSAWTLNGAVFNFSGYVNERITSDVTLKANYVKKETKTNTNSNNSNNNFNNSTTTNKPSNTTTSVGYQQIYNEYSQKLKNAGPTSSINEMAKILNEGMTKMAQYMYSAKGTDGQYATYQSWAGKLYDVYMSECR